MANPLVSILIPAYNAEEWIRDTIRSAMAQTWEPKEIIIVDDGSTDRTFEVAQRFGSESVRVVRREHQGAAAARNAAFLLSRGDYIQWLDADDLLASDKIARQMEVLNSGGSPRVLLSSSFGWFMYRPYRAKFSHSALWNDLSPTEFLLRKMGQKAYMQTAVWLVSRELTEAAGPWDTSLIIDDDGEYFCRVVVASEGIRFVPEACVYYRHVGVRRLSYIGESNERLDALWRSMQLHIFYLRSLEDSERTRAACFKYLQGYLLLFYPQRADVVEQMRKAAKELGGQLEVPRLSWKYAWIKEIAGWDAAKRAQLFFPRYKWVLKRSWDKLLCRVQAHG